MLNSQKCALGTVVYNEALKYKEDFIKSVNEQTYRDFDVIILNDGVLKENVEKIADHLSVKSYIITAAVGSTISENRIKLMAEAKKMGYEVIVFEDFDDVSAPTRIESIMSAYDGESAFYYGNIKTFDETDVFLSLPNETGKIVQIMEENYLGLGNTAIVLEFLDDALIDSLEEVTTNVFDWYLFSRIILNGGTGRFVESSDVYYRVHDNNIVGQYKRSLERIPLELKVKKNHYGLLRQYGSDFDDVIKMYDRLSHMSVEDIENKYLNTDFKGYWWSLIKCKGVMEDV